MPSVMKTAKHRDCPLCGGSRVEWLKQVSVPQPSTSPLPDQYDLAACTACDFVYADTTADQACYDRYYASLAKYAGAQASGAGEDDCDRRRLLIAAQRLRQWLSSPALPWLDIGCGRGGLLQAMADLGSGGGVGLDPDPHCAEAAVRNGLHVQCGTLKEAPTIFGKQRFDLVVLSHVVEHVLDLDLLKAAASLLSDSGHLYIEVPDASRYSGFERTPFYYLDSEHINHFGPHALGRLMQTCGLSIRHCTAVDLPLPDGIAYPALTMIASRGPAGALPAKGLISAMRTYLEQSQEHSALSLTPSLPPTSDILVWGAGSMTQRLLGTGLLNGYRIRCFIDNDTNKQGRTLADAPIMSPDEALALHPGVAVVLCVAINPQAVAEECRAKDPHSERTLHWLV